MLHFLRSNEQSVYLKILLVVLLSIGFFLRFHSLETIPFPADTDELVKTFDAYSISKTCRDKSGEFLPILQRGVGNGDYSPFLFSWLEIVPINLFGFSLFSGRLTSAIIGFLTIFLVFVIVKNLANYYVAIIALLFIAVSPWHILNSRIAHEGATLPAFFIVVMIILYQRILSHGYKPYYIIPLGFVIGFSANAYTASRVSSFLLSILFFSILVFGLRKLRSNYFKAIFLYFNSVLIGAAPQIWAMLKSPEHFFGRFDSEINKSITISKFTSNILSYYSPDFLFLSHNHWDLAQGPGLTSIEMPFFYIGIAYIIFSINKEGYANRLMLFGISLTCLIAPSVCLINPVSIRSASVIPLFHIFSAFGVWFIWQIFLTLIQKWIFSFVLKDKNFFLITIIVGVTLLNSYFIFSNFLSSDQYKADGRKPHFVEIALWLKAHHAEYDKVIVDCSTREFDLFYMYVIFYVIENPDDLDKMEKVGQFSSEVDTYQRIGKFYFEKSILKNLYKNNNEKTLLILKDIKIAYQPAIHSIKWQNAVYRAYSN